MSAMALSCASPDRVDCCVNMQLSPTLIAIASHGHSSPPDYTCDSCSYLGDLPKGSGTFDELAFECFLPDLTLELQCNC